MPEAMVNVRYMVDDVEAAIAWYTTHLGFTLLSSAAPAFADVTRGPLLFGGLLILWQQRKFLGSALGAD